MKFNTTKGIRTIDDLLSAQQTNPALVEECFKQVTIVPDLERYLRWLSDSQSTVTIVSNLSRKQGRALGIHPSSAAKKGACLLKLYYECTGKIFPSRTYDRASQQIWDTGSLLHELFQAHFHEMYGDQFQDEVELKDDQLHIVSRTDGLFSFPNIRFVLEMKSIKEGGNFGWAKVQTTPFEDNVRQAYFYMKLANVPFAILFYICKNNGEFKEHPIIFDQKVWDEIYTATIAPVIQALEGGPKVKASPGWHCKQCSFYHGCSAAKEEQSYVKGSTRSWKRT